MSRIRNLIFCLPLLLSGCIVLSLHPFHTDETLVMDPNLLGTWAQEDQGVTWRFAADPSEDNAYRVYRSDGDDATGEFSGHLARIGDLTVLDLLPAGSMEGDEIWSMHLVPTHTAWALAIGDGTVEFSALDYEWTNSYLEENPDALKHERLESGDSFPVLTASSGELQEFLRKHAEDLFSSTETLTRIETAQPAGSVE